MRKQWIEKNVDLALLGKYIEDFLTGKGFGTKKDEFADGCTISAKPWLEREVREEIAVSVLGWSNDFVIEFLISERKRSSVLLGFITTIIGGGTLLLRSLKSQEALEKLEKEFWMWAEETIAHLVGSLKEQTSPV